MKRINLMEHKNQSIQGGLRIVTLTKIFEVEMRLRIQPAIIYINPYHFSI
jgi:hypothetical protein